MDFFFVCLFVNAMEVDIRILITPHIQNTINPEHTLSLNDLVFSSLANIRKSAPYSKSASGKVLLSDAFLDPLPECLGHAPLIR